ncbi:MAG: hypothetical protein E7617_01660 [Ruminococcaceae bacterium]|nr:hypothetical protein [Oscillospiraceae bacterium]
MKNLVKKISLLLIVFALGFTFLAACDNLGGTQQPDGGEGENNQGGSNTIVYSFELQVDKTVVNRGDKVTLNAVLKSVNGEEPASDEVEYIIVEGASLASVSGNVLTVNNTAKNGDVIKVKAREGATDSAPVTLTVSIPATEITLSAQGVTNLTQGLSVVLTHTVAPEGASDKVDLVITEGSDSAVIVGNVLVVNANAETGAVIKVKAVAGEVESNELSFTVGYPLQSLTAVSALTNIVAGNSAQLAVTLNPQNATNGSYVWQITEGNDYAVVLGDVLTVNQNAPTGAIVKVKAVAGAISSNELSFTVGYPLQTLNVSLLGSANIKNGNSAQLAVTLDPQNATNGSYTWEITEGADYATIIGNIITINEDAPIGASVKFVAVAGSIRSNEIHVIVGTPVESITASSAISGVLDRGASYPLSVSVTPTGASADNVTWVVEEGGEYASVSSGLLFINSNTPAGTKVTVYATSGSVKSNSLTFTVGVVLESIEISLIGSSNVDPDGSRTLSVTLNPANASDTTVNWVISDGADYASIMGGTLSIKSDAPIGAKISFHAEIGEVKSNTVTVTVGTPIESIVIEAIGSTEVVKGNTVGLSAELTPSGASASLLEWMIVDGEEFATIKGSTLIVNSNAETGATIKVKAKFYDVESNELSFTVMATQEEINASKYMLGVSSNSIRLDKKGTSSPKLVANVIDGNFQAVTDLNLQFTILSGEQYLALSQDGYVCSFTALGHGNAEVEVRILGTEIAETVSVEVIVPPESISLPDVFVERPGFDYNFSLKDPISGNTEKLPFLPIVRGDALACTELGYSFLHESGASGAEVAVYEDGKITFKKTGRITVIVSSMSGSLHEAQTTYSFNINEGYNVETFEELSYVIERDDFKGYKGEAINIVVLEKPVNNVNDYKYGFALVPSIALNTPASEQPIAKLIRAYTTYNGHNVNVRIQTVNNSLHINGNNHSIDASQVKTFTLAEYEAYADDYGLTGVERFPNYSSLFSVEAWASGGAGSDPTVDNQTYSVKIYDLDVKGNAPIDFDPRELGSTDGSFVGGFESGISIGSREYNVHYYIDADNLTASAFKNGLKFNSIVGNGVISNLHAYNCYSTGVVVASSIVTLENLKLGLCGATGIELAPEECTMAGINDNENSKITIMGTVDASTNLNAGNTTYFQNYTIQGATVPQIITLNTQNYAANQVNHIRNSNGQFIFVSLLFYDLKTLSPNTSVVEYPAYQKGGIIDISQLPTEGIDTEHQFIKMDIYAPITGVGTVKVGEAYFYNHNYSAD